MSGTSQSSSKADVTKLARCRRSRTQGPLTCMGQVRERHLSHDPHRRNCSIEECARTRLGRPYDLSRMGTLVRPPSGRCERAGRSWNTETRNGLDRLYNVGPLSFRSSKSERRGRAYPEPWAAAAQDQVSMRQWDRSPTLLEGSQSAPPQNGGRRMRKALRPKRLR